ncbi:MAG: thiol-disulfide oxidoreductase DCC [Halobacteriovoraceae bacterium]|nr:thiol-disulfide oxidoreductase DCC [Halobacteriovoraceae bacterium]|tara:strand:+ start:228545 stop:228937 length:393 start_codon:yes stop_codon:yes gene_type:complete
MDKPIVFFDGECALCDSFVSFVLKADKDRNFYFAPLQGHTAKKYLTDKTLGDVDSVILFDGNQTLIKSEAVLAIMAKLGFPWSIFLVFKAIPKAIRDVLYELVAKNRIKLFGKKDMCKLPSTKERQQILD